MFNLNLVQFIWFFFFTCVFFLFFLLFSMLTAHYIQCIQYGDRIKFDSFIGWNVVELFDHCISKAIENFHKLLQNIEMKRWRNDLSTIMPFFAWNKKKNPKINGHSFQFFIKFCFVFILFGWINCYWIAVRWRSFATGGATSELRVV